MQAKQSTKHKVSSKLDEVLVAGVFCLGDEAYKPRPAVTCSGFSQLAPVTPLDMQAPCFVKFRWRAFRL